MTPEERAQAICDALDESFLWALRNDPNTLIDLARASSAAAATRDQHEADERAAFDPATDPVEAARLRNLVRTRRQRFKER